MAEPGTSAAMLEVWPLLAAGASVIIMDDTVAADPALTCRWLKEKQVTAIIAGEQVAEALATGNWTEETTLRLVIIDAEATAAMPADHPFRIVVTYGHDECSMVAAFRDMGRNERHGGTNVGRPIRGAAIYILKETGELVSSGEEGEIWIGGRGVGRGYRNRPDLTAEWFVPDPFCADPGGMIFRTGCRGRRLISGDIGRCDQHSARLR